MTPEMNERQATDYDHGFEQGVKKDIEVLVTGALAFTLMIVAFWLLSELLSLVVR